MGSDLIVVTGSTLPPDDPRTGTLKLYLSQLENARIESYVKYLAEMPHAEGGAPGTLESFISALRNIANQFSDYECIVCTDGWDVTFFGTREDVIRKVPLDKCLIGAAKECYPWGVAERAPSGDGNLRIYANGGLIAGTPQSILNLADIMEKHPSYRPRFENQGMFNVMLAEKSDAFYLDSKTDLFFCLYDGYEELDFENGLPVNRLTETRPNWLHANGKWDTTEMFSKYEESLK